MKAFSRTLVVSLLLVAILASAGCVSCIPQYVAPPIGSVSSCYPTGHDPYVPMDHNTAVINPWDWIASLFTPFMYGPPR